MLTTHLDLVLRLGMSGVIPLLPYIPLFTAIIHKLHIMIQICAGFRT